jgi:hypothetical protein
VKNQLEARTIRDEASFTNDADNSLQRSGQRLVADGEATRNNFARQRYWVMLTEP